MHGIPYYSVHSCSPYGKRKIQWRKCGSIVACIICIAVSQYNSEAMSTNTPAVVGGALHEARRWTPACLLTTQITDQRLGGGGRSTLHSSTYRKLSRAERLWKTQWHAARTGRERNAGAVAVVIVVLESQMRFSVLGLFWRVFQAFCRRDISLTRTLSFFNATPSKRVPLFIINNGPARNYLARTDIQILLLMNKATAVTVIAMFFFHR